MPDTGDRCHEERERAQQRLAEREAWWQALVSNTLDVISIIEPDATIRYESPAVERLTGWKPEELVGRNGFSFIHPDDLAGAKSALAGVIASPGGQVSVAFRLRRKDGSWVWVEAMGTNRLDDAQVAGVIVSLRDITERRLLDERLRQAQKMEAIGRLAGGVAHDFNNLLTGILGYAAILRSRLPDDPALRRPVDEIVRASDRAAVLVRQLLTFSRRQPARARVVRVSEVLTGIDSLMRRLIGETIAVATSPVAGDDRVLLDPGQLEQVVLNLAVNARDAMPEGGTLTISIAEAELTSGDRLLGGELPGGSYVCLMVSDTGHGMDADTANRIFEPFFTTKPQNQGTGLGLSVAYGIVRQAGGAITVATAPGKGARFAIVLPRADGPAEPSPLSNQRLGETRGSETVLVAEDEAAVRALLKAVLADAGYTVLAAQDGRSALELAHAHGGKVHLLITDVVMPGLSGKTLAAALRREQPDARVLFISGYNDEGSGIKAGLGRDVGFLAKPFRAEELLARVRALLEGR